MLGLGGVAKDPRWFFFFGQPDWLQRFADILPSFDINLQSNTWEVTHFHSLHAPGQVSNMP
jgi:hypothetical protein